MCSLLACPWWVTSSFLSLSVGVGALTFFPSPDTCPRFFYTPIYKQYLRWYSVLGVPLVLKPDVILLYVLVGKLFMCHSHKISKPLYLPFLCVLSTLHRTNSISSSVVVAAIITPCSNGELTFGNSDNIGLLVWS